MSWSWPLFAWGLSVGGFGVAGSYAIGRVAGLGYEQRRAYLGLVVLSLIVGTIAAAIPSTGVDVGFTVFVMIANFAVPLLLLLRASRPAAPHSCASATDSCTGDACAGCPLGAQAKTKLTSA